MLARWLEIATLLRRREPWAGNCLLCEQPSTAPLLCQHCRSALKQSRALCQLCAFPLPQGTKQTMCGHCQLEPPNWSRLQVIGDYQAPYPQLINRFKYDGELLLAAPLAQLLADHLDGSDLPEAIVPVPLHWWRQWQRGFNQAEELANQLAKRLNLPVENHLLVRQRATKQQAQLSAAERKTNLRGAFRVRSHHYRHLALLDDVVTTGTTAATLVELLRASGVERVEVWALCRTLKHYD